MFLGRCSLAMGWDGYIVVFVADKLRWFCMTTCYWTGFLSPTEAPISEEERRLLFQVATLHVELK